MACLTLFHVDVKSKPPTAQFMSEKMKRSTLGIDVSVKGISLILIYR